MAIYTKVALHFFLTKKSAGCLERWMPVSDNIMTARFTSLVQVYALSFCLILGLNFIFLCFKFVIKYHIQKRKENSKQG